LRKCTHAPGRGTGNRGRRRGVRGFRQGRARRDTQLVLKQFAAGATWRAAPTPLPAAARQRTSKTWAFSSTGSMATRRPARSEASQGAPIASRASAAS
jgi:hypothetical protein